jgi:hypothetical protein
MLGIVMALLSPFIFAAGIWLGWFLRKEFRE